LKLHPAISIPAWLVLLLLAALQVSAANKSTPAKPAKADDGFKPFASIAQQNVFNTHRGSASPVVAAPKSPKPAKPLPLEAFALLGTLRSERGAVAFFDGTSPVYRKAVATGEQLGPYTVTVIEHDRVTLKAGDRELCLPLKMQFRREGEGEWLLAELPDDFQPTEPPPGQPLMTRSSEGQGPAREQARDYVASKYQRKLEQLANDPVKAEKLLRAMNGEVEARVKKLEKLERRQP
jgi:Tfp pilus assembly protein PilP